MVQKLAAQGLVTHVPYGPIAPDDEPATHRARSQVIRRHRLIETWLVQRDRLHLGQVHDEAEVLEHALSDRLLEAHRRAPRPPAVSTRTATRFRLPTATSTARPSVLLAEAAPGSRGAVVRVSDRDPAVLRAARAENGDRPRHRARRLRMPACSCPAAATLALERRRARQHLAQRLTPRGLSRTGARSDATDVCAALRRPTISFIVMASHIDNRYARRRCLGRGHPDPPHAQAPHRELRSRGHRHPRRGGHGRRRRCRPSCG